MFPKLWKHAIGLSSMQAFKDIYMYLLLLLVLAGYGNDLTCARIQVAVASLGHSFLPLRYGVVPFPTLIPALMVHVLVCPWLS